MKQKGFEHLLRFLGVRKVSSVFINLKKKRVTKFLLSFIPSIVLYSAFFFGLSIIFFYFSRVIEQEELNTTLSEFLYKEELNFIDSYFLNIKLTFENQLPSYFFEPLSFGEVYSNWDNSLILLSICVCTSILLGLIVISIIKHIRSKTARKVVDYIFGLDRLLSPLLFISLISSIFISIKADNVFLFDQNNPESWLLPVLLISLPTSNFMYRTLLEIEVSWKVGGERRMFFSIGEISSWAKTKYMAKQAVIKSSRSLFLIILGTLALQLLVEALIGFNGLGEIFVKNITNNEIWLTLGAINFVLLIVYIYLVFNATFNKKNSRALLNE